MKIFLSYASENHDIAEQIYLALISSGHSVFFDRDNLPAGNGYHDRIRTAIEDCGVFIFLISSKSIEKGGYALTELKFARQKWPDPHHNVLPVLIEKVSYTKIPNYLLAVTILEPEGNIAAEVAASLREWTAKDKLIRVDNQDAPGEADKSRKEQRDSVFLEPLRKVGSFLLGGLSAFLIVDAVMLLGVTGPEGDVLLVLFFGVLAASFAFVLWPRRSQR